MLCLYLPMALREAGRVRLTTDTPSYGAPCGSTVRCSEGGEGTEEEAEDEAGWEETNCRARKEKAVAVERAHRKWC